MTVAGTPRWSWAWPVMAWLLFLMIPIIGTGVIVGGLAGPVLLCTVFAAVYHAEVVAHRVGEPYGTLVLALAVTVIETALIVSVMVGAPAEKAALARDTVFAAVMIVCNGIVGACLLWGGIRHHEQGFQAQGASAAMAVLVALTGLTMILPNLAAQELGPLYNTPQLIFAGLVSLVLYFAFVFIQTVRHRHYFLPVKPPSNEDHVALPDNRTTALSAGLLLVSLTAVVALGKILTPPIERGISYLQVPESVVGIVIALLVLLPEAAAAIKAARNDRLQTSLNLALGSALATIGLTIPAVAAVSIVLGYRLELGLEAKEQGLLALTLLLGVITLSTGRTTVLQGVVHLVMFAAYIFFAVVP
ncbi:Ca2+:H+ antiporter [Bradyrhizobium sp. USDA 3650]